MNTPSEKVLAEAVRLAGGDLEKALQWYFNMPLSELNGLTPASAVQGGQEGKVLRLLEFYDLGSLG